MKKKLIGGMVGISLLPMATFAHEGHGTTNGFSIIHYFTEPEHALSSWLTLSALIATVLYVNAINRKDRRERKH